MHPSRLEPGLRDGHSQGYEKASLGLVRAHLGIKREAQIITSYARVTQSIFCRILVKNSYNDKRNIIFSGTVEFQA